MLVSASASASASSVGDSSPHIFTCAMPEIKFRIDLRRTSAWAKFFLFVSAQRKRIWKHCTFQ